MAIKVPVLTVLNSLISEGKKKMKNMNRLFKSVLLVTASAIAAFGQTTGEVRGVVADATGAAIFGAKIVVASGATGESRTV